MRKLIKNALGHPAAGRLAGRLAGPPVVALCYHDLRENDDYDSWLRISVRDFEAHLTALQRDARFVDPAALEDPARLDRDRVNILLTFDDGYVNNFRLGLPVLAKLGIPAVFFIATGPMLSQLPFRADVLSIPLQASAAARLDLRPFGFADYVLHPVMGPRRWHDINRILLDLKRVGNDDHPRVAAVLEHFRNRFSDLLARHLPRFRPLSPEEVRAMADHPLVHLGSHGHDHKILTYMDDANLSHSLTESKRLLEDLSGRPVHDLAYPNGSWDLRVANRAKNVGFRRAWTTSSGMYSSSGNQYGLPRILIGGYDSIGDVRFSINRSVLAGILRRPRS